MSNDAEKRSRAGVLFAIAAYSMWGLAPMYFKLLQSMPAIEILMHRVVWSAVILAGLIVGFKQKAKVIKALRSRKVMTILLIAGLLLGANWLLFIWAINSNQLLDASLGYYINPLINILLGRLFLGEKLRPLQQVAVVLAILGVSVLVFSYGELPWIALVLAGTFGVYGLLRKQVDVDSLPGLFIETMMMLPFAVIFWVWFASPQSNMAENSLEFNAILIAAGVVTTAPLLCFTAAARRIMYSTLGFFQYIGPTMMFILAVFLYGEPLEEARLITFAFVWTGLLLFSFDSLRFYHRQKKLRLNNATSTR
ncbi:EamA family transporter RarD [Alteromonas sp. MYP5]|uniref:EamA family transporter RarD n=1 Tax=Alteromonas ponticola TaxID=2720613 RepID=A0ABX1R3X0_9ALTE|nr:EamA family transporter RarD [Alteromonas ponticola]